MAQKSIYKEVPLPNQTYWNVFEGEDGEFEVQITQKEYENGEGREHPDGTWKRSFRGYRINEGEMAKGNGFSIFNESGITVTVGENDIINGWLREEKIPELKQLNLIWQ